MAQSRTTLFAAAAALALSASAAGAQSACMPRDRIVDRLEAAFSEKLAGRGLESSERIFEIFISQDGGSWTIIQTFADGVSCIMATGTLWISEDPDLIFGIPG